MVAKRYLIVNADDFGQSPGVNQGVIEAHEHGIVSSASLMVRWPSAVEAAAYSRAHLSFSVGLHLDLGEWTYQAGGWMPLYEVVPSNDLEAVKDEVYRQLATFHRLVGKDPTHIDSHQHVHLREPVRTVLLQISHKLAVPLRHCSPNVCYRGNFYGQTAEGTPRPGAVSVEGLINILAMLSPGFTELGCHPGMGNDIDSLYRDERVEETRVLCDPRVRAAIAAMGIQLRSFVHLSNG
jgi:predicted glycoside hydrolase/deacetylase ChbG (UPF0249 family)